MQDEITELVKYFCLFFFVREKSRYSHDHIDWFSSDFLFGLVVQPIEIDQGTSCRKTGGTAGDHQVSVGLPKSFTYPCGQCISRITPSAYSPTACGNRQCVRCIPAPATLHGQIIASSIVFCVQIPIIVRP